MKYSYILASGVLITLSIPGMANAQIYNTQAVPVTTSPQQQVVTPAYTQEQLDQMLAPIALYPDSLVSQILMASTYPLDVVEAYRWQQDPNNATLMNTNLANALAQQAWDPSVKSLLAYPQVLKTMNDNLSWMEQLGDAFLAQQADVMDSVQRLRQQAQAAGALASTPQQAVSYDDNAIEIQPVNPNIIYVPEYDPSQIYGSWPYASYPPYRFQYTSPVVYNSGLIGFSAGITVAALFLNWDRWDWHNHRIYINNTRYSALNRGHPPTNNNGVWRHDPGQRRGVPYQSATVRTQYQNTAPSAAARRSYRGYSASPAAVTAPAVPAQERPQIVERTVSPANNATQPSRQHNPGQRTDHTRAPSATPAQPTAQAPNIPSPQQGITQVQRGIQATPQATTAKTPALYESFSRGSDVHVQSARGVNSRATPPAPQAIHAPAPQHTEAPHAEAPRPQQTPAAQQTPHMHQENHTPNPAGHGQRPDNKDKDHQ